MGINSGVAEIRPFIHPCYPCNPRLKIPSLGLLLRKKIRGRGRSTWGGGLEDFAFLGPGIERMEVFLLHLRHFARVMAFTGVAEEEQTGERDERKQSKHARGE